MKKSTKIKQIVLPVIAAVIWGISFVAQDQCAGILDAFTVNAARSFVAYIVLLLVYSVYSRLKQKENTEQQAEKPDAKMVYIGGLCCGIALAVATNFQQAGIIAGTDAGKSAFITALYVVLVPIFGLFFKREVSLNVWIAVGISVIALFLLCVKAGVSFALGDLLCLVCAFSFAVHILVVDYFTKYVDGVLLSCSQFFFCGLISLICALIWGTSTISDIMQCIWPILYLGVFSCGVAYTLQIIVQKDCNPTVASILFSLESVFAVLFSALLLDERMSGREYLGCILMFAAILIAQLDFEVLIPSARNKE